MARLADAAGMDLWVGDSIVAKPRLEPLTTLAYLAAITTRARLGTAILLPARINQGQTTVSAACLTHYRRCVPSSLARFRSKVPSGR